MEKLINRIYKLRFFSWLIAFFIGGVFYSLTCKAQALPNIDPGVFSLVQLANEGLIDVGFLPQDIIPYGEISTRQWSPWNVGYSVLSQIDINDCEITPLTDSQKSQLLSSFYVVDINGSAYDETKPIYCVEYDNGYFTGQCYVDDEGKMLAYTDNLGGHLLQSRFGGNIKDVADWQEMYEDTALSIYDNDFILYDHPEVVGNNNLTYYCFYGQEKYSRPYQASELYIPNQYQKGVIVPTTTQNGMTINEWYCNNLKSYVYHEVMGPFNDGNYTPFYVTPGTYNFQGVTYNYKLHYVGAQPANNTYDAWLNGQNVNNRFFASQGYVYNSSYSQEGNSSTAFKPLQIPEGSQVINYNYYYDYDSISRLEQQLNDLIATVNSNFNNAQPISENNFPFYYPIGDTETEPSEIPFPSIENYPGFEPMPSNKPQYDPNVNPSIENPYPDVNPANINNTIPIISGLQNKFPFSIPWDIYNLIKGLSAERQAPVLDFEITFPVINYTWNPVIDLSMYNSTAELLRTLLLILFIIGLAVFSYNHFFGS